MYFFIVLTLIRAAISIDVAVQPEVKYGLPGDQQARGRLYNMLLP